MHNDGRYEVRAAQPNQLASEVAWQAILQRVADSVDSVVEDFLSELHGSSLYEDGFVEHADLRHSAHETFRYLLDQMTDKPMSVHQQDAAKRLGARRARQKVQLEDLMAAIRLDFIVLWRRMRTVMTPEEMPVLVDHTEILLTTIEHYIREVQLEFLAETARIARDARLASERHLARLLNTTDLSDGAIELIAQGLNVPVDGCFEVVVIHEDSVLSAHDALVDPLATGEIMGYPYGPGYSLIKLQDGNLSSLFQLCSQYAGGYMSNVADLSQVPTAVASLTRLLKFHPDLPALTHIDQMWPAAVAGTLTGLLPDFPDRYIAGLDALPANDRTDVIIAIRKFLDTGSVKDTAKAIGRHRNTVINRLNTFEASTALDVKVPRDALMAALVLACPRVMLNSGIDQQPVVQSRSR